MKTQDSASQAEMTPASARRMLEAEGAIAIVGAMYDIGSGAVTFLQESAVG